MATVITQKSSSKCFGGYQKVYTHESKELSCTMNFAVYLPPQAETEKCPVIYYLSGLTCTEQNFIQKAGAQRYASKYGLVIVTCDTSPRGCNIPGEDEKWNIGTGAGYYVNATQEPWSKHYRMYSYINSELPAIIEEHFPVLPDKQSIMGHSMGGHGAFLCAFRNPGRFKSVSALAPVCDSARCRPFKEGFKFYFGGEPEDGTWDEWNATKLATKYNGPPLQILIDQGTDDEFLNDLYPTDFTAACTSSGVSVILNMRDGYDHGYFFVSTFIKDHIKYHVKFLKQ